jgi:hypothetical protein
MVTGTLGQAVLFVEITAIVYTVPASKVGIFNVNIYGYKE